ncbi:MerR family DNA-binding transcriptional regulator [Paenibacillus harenae]|uniref:DNA-binding transcriptional MerR regulator n=1 Tax=Paenibacillus harenae TaxID=306543 RepID=A0ABT9TX06_PAEHA|nr:MerR family transcriptional regulator [Paenibacillus harenae]MDQ0111431.1 DNA-binding transcriptional MerR regulator [Paenibacillus harenae]
MRPIDIAKKLNISTSALRHYESWGVLPPVERGANGYRNYTELHFAYFECIRAMNEGFGMTTTVEVLKLLLSNHVDEALWIVNEAQAELQSDKLMAEKTIEALDAKELDNLDRWGRRKWMSIGEVSKATSVPASAIRHWEKMGLITVSRNDENGYRIFSPTQIRQILIIGTLRMAVWSLDTIKQVIHELDHNNIEQARRIAKDSLRFLNKINRNRMKGIRYLYRLIEWEEGSIS